ncbi:MAG TPA: SMP-30/gluconolactonase/LRE family protein [Acidimicrobiia bacterium]|nr:SMP-30/gluconolactonase/LRE family protein [Acidimicrobiia bacterium]
MADPTTLLADRAFLEGPRWHDRALWVSDMHAGEVLRVGLDGTVVVVAHVDGDPSGLGWLPDGSLLIVSMRDRRVLRLGSDDQLQVHADCSGVAAHEINDMVVDRHGHAFISQFGFDFHGGAPYTAAPLLRVDPDGAVHEGADGLRMGNGLVVTSGGATLVVAESTGKDLVGFDLSRDGTLSNRRVWAPLPDYPDGICIDRDDGIWVASPVGDRFVRVVEGGDVTDVVTVPGRHAIACALGGNDGRTLFLCTSSTHGEPERSRTERGARVETVTVAVPAPG